MTTFSTGSGPSRTRGRWIPVILAASFIVVLVAVLFGPLVSLPLTGDSYQWIQHAHAAAHEPALLFSDLDTFLRPSTTWTLIADRVVWGGFEARGYRISSLGLHGLAALALVIAGRRLGLGWFAAVTVGLVWVASPYTDESACVVAYRFEPLLMISWLAMVSVWPRADESWSRLRLIAAGASIFAAAAAKETWVMTPILVAALEANRHRPWRAVLIPTLAVGSAVAAYMLGYFVAFPTSKTYFELGPHIIAKLPAQLAAFFYLEVPMTTEISLTWMSGLATASMIALVVACVRWRVAGSLVAGCLFLVPTIPTLLVPYMPQRYLAIPYAGFLLLIALWASAAGDRLRRWRWPIRIIAVLTAILVAAAGGFTVRADLDDYRTMAEAHASLLREAESVKASVSVGHPVLIVRDEQTTPLLEIVTSPRGLPKLVFIRNHDPYGLIDAAALFEWVSADEGTRVEHVEDWAAVCEGVTGAVLVHRIGGFADLGTTPNLASEAKRWQSSGRGVQVVRKIALGTGL